MIFLLLFSFILSVICFSWFFSFYYYCLLIYIFCALIFCSQFFPVIWITWYPLFGFAWKFSLLPWCYFVLPLTIYHSFPELYLSISLIFHLSAFTSICSDIVTKRLLLLHGYNFPVIIVNTPTINEVISGWKSYNHVDNILRLFDGWANFPFTANKMKRDYW